MENKRGTKRSCSPVSGSSSSLGSASTLLLSPSMSLQPPGSPPEVSSPWPLSPTYEHGGPSERILVVDLSSDEEDMFPDTSRDEEFARKLFDDLNCGLLGPSDNSNAIVLNDSDEEKEVCEEDAADAEAAPPSVGNFPGPTISAPTTLRRPIRGQMIVMMVEMRPVSLRLPRQKGCLQGGGL
jgi:hypothetical protein